MMKEDGGAWGGSSSNPGLEQALFQPALVGEAVLLGGRRGRAGMGGLVPAGALGEQCEDLESWSNGFQNRFSVHLGSFVPRANLSHASGTLSEGLRLQVKRLIPSFGWHESKRSAL